MLTHLGGAMYAMAGFMVLAASRQWRASLLYAGLAALVFLPCVVDIALHWELFRIQTSNPQAQSKFAFTALTPIMNLLNEQQRFFRKPHFIVMSLVWLASLWATWRVQSDFMRLMRRYTLVMTLTLGVGGDWY